MKTWECVGKTTHENQLVVPGEIVVTGDEVELGRNVFKLIKSEPDNPESSLEDKTVAELKALADEMRISHEKNIKKGDLIKLIEEARTKEAQRQAETGNPPTGEDGKSQALPQGEETGNPPTGEDGKSQALPQGEETGVNEEKKGLLKSALGILK